ncbi:hypothetical protein IP68_10475 [Blastomonas sp. AAP25]|uniref:hypothetical protein n=1 Tax=Blastomonas sp. AAP25 TaxID=1523416 RepID=UPI0006B92027|nr:hypothetical protein [Blastomonas sp. AAP25]KPF75038.1 hypothetical protein IP68_10475 [Blastomonas sp. AAP25]
MQKRHPGEGGAVLLAGNERAPSTKSTPTAQPASVNQLRALHLIANRNVRPELAMTLAALAFGGAA